MFDHIYICDCHKIRDTDTEIALDYILRLVMLPYIYGGDDFKGFDCSGYACEYEKAKGKIERDADFTAQQLFDMSIELRSWKRGCEIYYGKDRKSVSHVAICLNQNLCAEAGGGNKNTLTIDEASKRNAFVKIRSIHSRNDFIAFAEIV